MWSRHFERALPKDDFKIPAALTVEVFFLIFGFWICGMAIATIIFILSKIKEKIRNAQ